jgi:hypothetical protein
MNTLWSSLKVPPVEIFWKKENDKPYLKNEFRMTKTDKNLRQAERFDWTEIFQTHQLYFIVRNYQSYRVHVHASTRVISSVDGIRKKKNNYFQTSTSIIFEQDLPSASCSHGRRYRKKQFEWSNSDPCKQASWAQQQRYKHFQACRRRWTVSCSCLDATMLKPRQTDKDAYYNECEAPIHLHVYRALVCWREAASWCEGTFNLK